LLLVANDENQGHNVMDLIGNDDVRIKTVGSNKDLSVALKKRRYDCVVIDLNFSFMPAGELFELLWSVEKASEIPVIVLGMNSLTKQEQQHLRQQFSRGIVKEVQSIERLFDETALFLHRAVSVLPDNQRGMLENLYHGSASLEDKKVLVVDDDIRNIFALASVLERNKMEVLSAENGKTAIELLMQNPDIDIVLMDIMMPEMDGLETMRRIRQIEQFENLPMIALTAKAMKGDREKCIEAGASDYVSKPVDTDQLLSLMRSWLYR
jgi:CheY-like chemotaxis protein